MVLRILLFVYYVWKKFIRIGIIWLFVFGGKKILVFLFFLKYLIVGDKCFYDIY